MKTPTPPTLTFPVDFFENMFSQALPDWPLMHIVSEPLSGVTCSLLSPIDGIDAPFVDKSCALSDLGTLALDGVGRLNVRIPLAWFSAILSLKGWGAVVVTQVQVTVNNEVIVSAVRGNIPSLPVDWAQTLPLDYVDYLKSVERMEQRDADLRKRTQAVQRALSENMFNKGSMLGGPSGLQDMGALTTKLERMRAHVDSLQGYGTTQPEPSSDD